MEKNNQNLMKKIQIVKMHEWIKCFLFISVLEQKCIENVGECFVSVFCDFLSSRYLCKATMNDRFLPIAINQTNEKYNSLQTQHT